MYYTRVIFILFSWSRMAFCTALNGGYLYSISYLNDDHFCPAEDRSAHYKIVNEKVCSIICTTEPTCESWVLQKSDQVCSTCRTKMDPNLQNTAPSNMIFGRLSGCSIPVDLVGGPYGVADQAMTASSWWGSGFEPFNAKFEHNGWAGARGDWSPYLQIAFKVPIVVTKVCTKGMGWTHTTQFVISYKLHYSHNCDLFYNVTDVNGITQIFPSGYNVECSDLTPPLKMKCLRVYPLTWYGHCTMRLQAIGC